MNPAVRTASGAVCVLGVCDTEVAELARGLRDHGANVVQALSADALPPADVYLLLGMEAGVSRPPDVIARLADEGLRAALRDAGRAFQVIHGRGPAALTQALRALGLAVRDESDDATARRSGGDWVWRCDACSDPECEHRLFTRLARSA